MTEFYLFDDVFELLGELLLRHRCRCIQEKPISPSRIIHHIQSNPLANIRLLLLIQLKLPTQPHPIRPQMIILMILQQHPLNKLNLPLGVAPPLNQEPPKLPPLEILNLVHEQILSEEEFVLDVAAAGLEASALHLPRAVV